MGVIYSPSNLSMLPNNAQINGVEHFYQTTKPTVRGDGSALVIGDRWWKSDEGTEWFWNGTYWLGELITYTNTSGINFANYGELFVAPVQDVWIERVLLNSYFHGGTTFWDVSNSFNINLVNGSGAPLSAAVTVNSPVGLARQATTHWYWTFSPFLNVPFIRSVSAPVGTCFVVRGSNRVGSPLATTGVIGHSVQVFMRALL